jgi:MEMO1 family protein
MNGTKVRPPAVAGQFYPSSPAGIRSLIAGFLKDTPVTARNAIACMMPHAGYVYSGKVAALTAASAVMKERVVLLGPNHTGYGQPYSVMSQGIWQTPLGELRIDTHMAESLIAACPLLESDDLAHAYEHSLEVELPILQYFLRSFSIVPIALLSRDLQALQSIGACIALVIKKMRLESSTLIVASTDMSHYRPRKVAEAKDKLALEAILALDETKLAAVVAKEDISMCGVAPVIVMIAAAKSLGASSATLVKYQTSAETSKDNTSVVGYAGVLIT